MDGADQIARVAGMNAIYGKARGDAHGQWSLKQIKNRCPTQRFEMKEQDVEVDGHLPRLAAVYSDHPQQITWLCLQFMCD